MEERLKELNDLREEFRTEWSKVNVSKLGYTTENLDLKKGILQTLEKMALIRDILLDEYDEVFYNGLPSVPYQIDWATTEEEILAEIDDIISDVKKGIDGTLNPETKEFNFSEVVVLVSRELIKMSGEELAELANKILNKKCSYKEDNIFVIENRSKI